MVIALILIAGFVIPFTYASAIDPTWLAGIYDDADYDEIVRLLTETSGGTFGAVSFDELPQPASASTPKRAAAERIRIVTPW